jgi:CubicO group peptidase (beta-lactamase class C family)
MVHSILIFLSLFWALASYGESQECPTDTLTFGQSEPEVEGVNTQQLINLTEWVKAHSRTPIFSILISKNGHVVYQLLTSSLTGEEAHYVMSVTKSVTSSLYGIALDKHEIKNTDQKITDILPSSMFTPASKSTFSSLSLKEVLGMSALYAPMTPHQKTDEAKKRFLDWYHSKSRLAYALTQSLVNHPGQDFFYSDVTATIAAGVLEYASGQSLFDYANKNLFGPMKFSNQEWMHEDASGLDNAGSGLRLRPIDMQKFGVLYLNHGCWDKTRLLSKSWVDLSFTPWIRSQYSTGAKDYGWYWWNDRWPNGWSSHGAIGWMGQRIEVFPKQKIVVTMTGAIPDGSEIKIMSDIITDFVAHLSDPLPKGSDVTALKAKLKSELTAIRLAPSRIPADTQALLNPSITPKEQHFPFKAM